MNKTKRPHNKALIIGGGISIFCAVAAVTVGLQNDLQLLDQYRTRLPDAKEFLKNSTDDTCKSLPLNFIQFQLNALKKIPTRDADEKAMLANAAAMRAAELAKLIADQVDVTDATYEDRHKDPSGETYTKGQYMGIKAQPDRLEFYKVSRGSVTSYGGMTDEQKGKIPDFNNLTGDAKKARFNELINFYGWSDDTPNSSILAVGIGKFSTSSGGYSNLVHSSAAKKLVDRLYNTPATMTASHKEKTVDVIVAEANRMIGALAGKDAEYVATACGNSTLYSTTQFSKNDKTAPDDDRKVSDAGDPSKQLAKGFEGLVKTPAFGLPSTTDRLKQKQEERFVNLLAHCPILAERLLSYEKLLNDSVAFNEAPTPKSLRLSHQGSPCYKDFLAFLKK